MTDLGLSDAVDTAETLLQAVRVPGQIIVDHQVRAALQVHAFARGIVTDENAYLRIVVESSDVGLAHVARHAAVDHDNGFMLANALADVAGEVFQRVARLGENEELATFAGRLVDYRRLRRDHCPHHRRKATEAAPVFAAYRHAR